MKLKIAICLYGLPRGVDISSQFNAKFFNSFREDFDVQFDYFCHTWATRDAKFNRSYDNLDVLRKLYDPVRLERQDPVETLSAMCKQKALPLCETALRRLTGSNCRLIGQFLSLEQSVKMAAAHDDYDIYWISRYDVAMQHTGRGMSGNFNWQLESLTLDEHTDVVYQPVYHGRIAAGYPQASGYYFVAGRKGKNFAFDFGYNIAQLVQAKAEGYDGIFADYLTDDKENSTRVKHAYWLQQYLTGVHMVSIDPEVRHTVVRPDCSLHDSFDQVAQKFAQCL